MPGCNLRTALSVLGNFSNSALGKPIMSVPIGAIKHHKGSIVQPVRSRWDNIFPYLPPATQHPPVLFVGLRAGLVPICFCDLFFTLWIPWAGDFDPYWQLFSWLPGRNTLRVGLFVPFEVQLLSLFRGH